MPNDIHYKILAKGVSVWNQWRDDNPTIRPTLNLSDLQGKNLSNANLSEADLVSANLNNANLSKANLYHADLVGADLRRVNFSDTDLSWAHLTRADLSDANLKGARLWFVEFVDSILKGADLSEASLYWTKLGNLDLSTVKGLESIKHRGPSLIGIETIYRSKGNMPEVFLRGVGLPDIFITYSKSFVETYINFYSCFISYSSKDHEFVEKLYSDLQSNGIRCWYAPQDLKIGDRFRDQIEESIQVYDKLLIILSENSILSPWVRREVSAAIEREDRQNKNVLFPIRLDDTVMNSQDAWVSEIRRDRHVGDFREWKDRNAYEKAFNRLLRDLKSTRA
jgi:hypothetical protein